MLESMMEYSDLSLWYNILIEILTIRRNSVGNRNGCLLFQSVYSVCFQYKHTLEMHRDLKSTQHTLKRPHRVLSQTKLPGKINRRIPAWVPVLLREPLLWLILWNVTMDLTFEVTVPAPARENSSCSVIHISAKLEIVWKDLYWKRFTWTFRSWSGASSFTVNVVDT